MQKKDDNYHENYKLILNLGLEPKNYNQISKLCYNLSKTMMPSEASTVEFPVNRGYAPFANRIVRENAKRGYHVSREGKCYIPAVLDISLPEPAI